MWAERTAALPRSARPRERPAKESLLLTEELIAQFLLEKERRGCVSDTVSGYRRHLLQLYQELPEDKEIRPGTLENWQSMLVEKGYAARTVNNWLSAANSLMEFCGRRELQVQVCRKCTIPLRASRPCWKRSCNPKKETE